MLKQAILYEGEVTRKITETWYEEKYKFVTPNVYCKLEQIYPNTWDIHQFVSVNEEDEVIGYIAYSINRVTNSVDQLVIYNFTDNSITFGLDLKQVFHDIFMKFNFHKVQFCVTIGNPVEKQYDKMIKKYHGRIVGILKDDAKCFDGKYYDVKLYEILRDEYMQYLSAEKTETTNSNSSSIEPDENIKEETRTSEMIRIDKKDFYPVMNLVNLKRVGICNENYHFNKRYLFLRDKNVLPHVVSFIRSIKKPVVFEDDSRLITTDEVKRMFNQMPEPIKIIPLICYKDKSVLNYNKVTNSFQRVLKNKVLCEGEFSHLFFGE